MANGTNSVGATVTFVSTQALVRVTLTETGARTINSYGKKHLGHLTNCPPGDVWMGSLLELISIFGSNGAYNAFEDNKIEILVQPEF